MARVPVKVRASCQQELQATRNVDVFLNESGVMIRMKGFHSVETGSSKRWNSRAKATLSGMGDRRDPAGGVNDLNDRFRGWAFSRHEAGQSTPEPAIEGLLRACHVSRLDHRARHLRPANRSAAFAAALLEHRFDVDRYAMGREA